LSTLSKSTIMPQMQATLNVYCVPEFVAPDELAGTTAVVIDVLRATTTIVYALQSGAREVIPCLEVADALALAKQFAPDGIELGGERHGTIIEGFGLGNSPAEYSPERVGGKTVLFTTTNGTRAMDHVRQADEILLAAFVNASAVVARLLDRERIVIVCAGTDGNASEDDVLLAGLLVDRLQRGSAVAYKQNAEATRARHLWLTSFGLSNATDHVPAYRLAVRLRTCLGAKNLIAIGLDADILAASQIDRFDLLPRLDLATFRISKEHRRPQR
jgi:2-phosphosulfolactate phosphatase